MSRTRTQSERIDLGLLESVQRDGTRSQRKLASELGIALGSSTPTSSAVLRKVW
jgi:DNA-binding Lrp family transcriptional regulator